jgi:hypothetical protein
MTITHEPTYVQLERSLAWWQSVHAWLCSIPEEQRTDADRRVIATCQTKIRELEAVAEEYR